MLTIGLAVVGAFGGGAIGLWWGTRDAGDYNFAPLATVPIGALVGTFVGMIVGQVISG